MVESEAVDRAVIECIEQNGELTQILLEHRSEVVNMLLAEFDEEAFIRDIHAEGLAEGLEKGMEKGLEEGLEKGLEKGLRSLIATLQKFISSLPHCQVMNSNSLSFKSDYTLQSILYLADFLII